MILTSEGRTLPLLHRQVGRGGVGGPLSKYTGAGTRVLFRVYLHIHSTWREFLLVQRLRTNPSLGHSTSRIRVQRNQYTRVVVSESLHRLRYISLDVRPFMNLPLVQVRPHPSCQRLLLRLVPLIRRREKRTSLTRPWSESFPTTPEWVKIEHERWYHSTKGGSIL